MRTWTHMINTTSTPFSTSALRRSKTEVSKTNSCASVPTKDIFRFEISVEDTKSVTMRNCCSKLSKYLGNETSPTQINLLMQDKSK